MMNSRMFSSMNVVLNFIFLGLVCFGHNVTALIPNKQQRSLPFVHNSITQQSQQEHARHFRIVGPQTASTTQLYESNIPNNHDDNDDVTDTESIVVDNQQQQQKMNMDHQRRQSFATMIGSILLPSATVMNSNTDVANAVDDPYPFKATVKRLAEEFPEAVPNADLIKKVTTSLNRYEYGESTLVAFSLCSDEVNRPLEDTFYGWYGEHFNMGGLAGFPFAGVTGFGAMAAHIPDGGSCLVVYGPHVGIDADGNVGKINRKGKGKAGSCCGSAVAASKYITDVYLGNAEKVGPPTDSVDAQQNFVAAALLPYGEAVATAKDPMVQLPYATFEPIDRMMEKIIKKAGGGVKDGKIAMLGGLQINTPRGMSDYFLPLRFDIRNSKAEIIENLLWTRKVGTEARRRA